MKLVLTLDSLALLLYCSELYDCDETPLTTKQWYYLEKKLRQSPLKRPAALLGLDDVNIAMNLEIDEALALKLANMNQCIRSLLYQLEKMETLGIYVTTKYEDSYPAVLKKKMKRKMPLILYYSGDINLLNSEMIYVSGPIKSNKNIDVNTRAIVQKIYQENYTLISSGSRGVEKLSIRTQIKNGGKVVNFVCGNLLKESQGFTKPIRTGQMLLLSARHPFASFDLSEAIDRNQYIYCMSQLVIVVYSQINAGATWLSAILNMSSHWTRLAAVVDDEFYGNARLIELGACPLTMEMIKSDVPLMEMCEQTEVEEKQPVLYDQLSIYDFLK